MSANKEVNIKFSKVQVIFLFYLKLSCIFCAEVTQVYWFHDVTFYTFSIDIPFFFSVEKILCIFSIVFVKSLRWWVMWSQIIKIVVNYWASKVNEWHMYLAFKRSIPYKTNILVCCECFKIEISWACLESICLLQLLTFLRNTKFCSLFN